MDPILAEIYSTVLGGFPFVLAGYALLFLVLMAYVAFIMAKLNRTEKKLAALEEHLDEA